MPGLAHFNPFDLFERPKQNNKLISICYIFCPAFGPSNKDKQKRPAKADQSHVITERILSLIFLGGTGKSRN